MVYEESSERSRCAWNESRSGALAALLALLAPMGGVAGAVERIVGAIRTMMMICQMIQKANDIFRRYTE